MAGLKKEVWINFLVGEENEFMHDNNWFLAKGVNMDAYVENQYVNFAHKGSVPTVSKNPTYPLTTVTRTDTPDRVKMSPYSTQRFRLPKVDVFQIAYDKKASLLKDQRDALVETLVSEGVWNVSPYENTTNTPVIVTPSGNTTGADGFKEVTKVELTNLRIKLDQAYPKLKNAAWTLVMDSYSFWTFISKDATLQAQVQYSAKLGDVNVPTINYFGFTLVADSRVPYYDSTNKRLAYGAVVDTGNGDRPACIAFVDNKSFAVAMGDFDAFIDEANSEYQADMGSFLMYGLISPFSEDLVSNLKYLGAIIRK